MRNFERMAKSLLLGFRLSPFRTLAEIGRRFTPKPGNEAQVLRLRQTTREAPLVLQIETTNICNAACVFCAYPVMQRPQGVMSMALFEKIIKDYAAMGGGPVSLTPIVGDALLDPHLMERMRHLNGQPKVNQVTMTTNAIALDRYSDEEVCRLLEALDCMQVSVGGLDAATYRTLYGVDRLPKVLAALDRLLVLRKSVANAADITFAFRTNDWAFELRHRRQLDGYRQEGVFISHIWTFDNYSGVIKDNSALNLHVMENASDKTATCVFACVHLAICWDGRVTACGCADFEGRSLCVGESESSDLAELWHGEKRARILDSFQSGRLAPICRQCTAYRPDSLFAQPFFKDVAARQPLPLEYLQQFWGG